MNKKATAIRLVTLASKLLEAEEPKSMRNLGQRLAQGDDGPQWLDPKNPQDAKLLERAKFAAGQIANEAKSMMRNLNGNVDREQAEGIIEESQRAMEEIFQPEGYNLEEEFTHRGL